MDWKEMRKNARGKFRGACRVCPVCDGVACAGEVPGMGGAGAGASFKNNVSALAGYRLCLRTVHSVHEPKLACNILGMDLAFPILAAPVGGGAMNMNGALTEAEYVSAVVSGCRKTGTIAMTGDGPDPDLFLTGIRSLKMENGRGIPIIKPRETDRVIELAKMAEAAGAPAFGMDIDTAAFVNMTRAGQKVGPKTRDELAYIKQHTSIPFIVKGIMMADDAAACLDAGVDAIVVSNHGGRVLDHTPGTAEALPYIADAVQGKMTILIDGGIRNGGDVLKMLALGADAVLIGRPVITGAVGGGVEGVELVLNRMAGELREAMVLTGTEDVAKVSEDILWY